MDKEKIEEAAQEYLVSEYYDACAHEWDLPCDIADIKTQCKKDFEAGALWAQQEFIKSLWHDASEEPDFESKRRLVCMYGETEDYAEGEIHSETEIWNYREWDWDCHFHTLNGLKDYKFDWTSYAKNRNILKWGYADEFTY